MLRKTLFVIATLILIASELFAQEKIIEFKLGGSLSKDFSSDAEFNSNQSLLTFPMAGFSFYSKTNENFWVMYGLEYQKLGDTYNYFTGFNNERTDVDITVNSIKVPIMVSYIGNLDNSITPVFKIGPSLDFAFGEAKIDPTFQLNNPDGFRENIDQGEIETLLNFGINVSAGAIIDTSTTKVILEIRYNRFVTDTFSNSKFSTIAFSIGLQLHKK